MAAKKTKKAAKKVAKKSAKKAPPAKKAVKKGAKPAKATKKAAKPVKKKKVKQQVIDVAIFSPGTIEVKGTLLAMDSSSVTVLHKKPRSKTMLRSIFPIKDVVSVDGIKKGGETTLVLFSAKVVHSEFEAVSVEYLEGGLVKIIDEDGDGTITRAEFVTASGVSDGSDAPADDEEEEEEDEDEEEEEEDEEEEEEEEEEEDEDEEEEEEDEEEEEEDEDEEEEDEDEEEEEEDDDDI